LGYETDEFSVALKIQICNRYPIDENGSFLDFIKSVLHKRAKSGMWENKAYLSRRDTILVFPQPEDPTRAAN